MSSIELQNSQKTYPNKCFLDFTIFYYFFFLPLILLFFLMRFFFSKETKQSIIEKFFFSKYPRPPGKLIWINGVSIGRQNQD